MNHQRGMTLIELMVAVAIIGVLVTVASVTLRTNPDVGWAANQVVGHLAEASRKAVAEGPLDPNIVDNEGFSARTRLVVDEDTAGQFVAIEVRREDGGLTSAWFEASRAYLPRGIRVAGYETGTARLTAGGTVTSLDGDPLEIPCEPTGECGTYTLYLEDTVDGDQKRIAMMPLSAAPQIFDGW